MLMINRNNETILIWTAPTPLVVYYFSIACDWGWVLWTDNCEPPDIDNGRVDGGWSEWSEWHCTKLCGTGNGVSLFLEQFVSMI